MEVGSVEARLAVDVSQWQAGLREAGSQAESFGKNADSVFAGLAKQMESAFGSLAQELRAVTTSLKEVVQEFRASTGQVASALGVMADRSKSAHQDAANAAKVAAQQAAEASRQASRMEAAEARASSQEQITAAKAASAAARAAAQEKEAEAKRAAAAALAAEKQAERESSAAAKAAAQERIQAARQAHEQEQALAKQTLAAQKAAMKEGVAAQKAALQETLAAQKAAAQATKGDGASKKDYSAGVQVVGVALSAAGTAGAGAFGGATKMFMDFEAQMRNVNSIVKESESGFRKMSDALLAMPRAEGLTQGPRELAAALYDISSSGFEGAKGLEVLKAAAKAADAGMSTAAVAAKGLTGLLNAYGKSADDAANVSDIMFKTVEKGVITYEELANSIGNVASTAATAGVSMEEMMAGVAALTLKGIKPDEAITALNGAITKLAAATPEARKFMGQLGIGIDEASVKAKGMGWAIQEIYTKTGGSLAGITRIVGDERAAKAVMALGADRGVKLQEFTTANKNAGGAAEAARAEQAKSITYQMKQAWAELSAISIKIGETIAPYIEMAVDVVKRLQVAWEGLSPAVQKASVIVAAIAGGVAAATGALILMAPSIAAVVSLFSGGALAAIGTGLAALTPIVLALGTSAAVLYVAWTDNWGKIQEKTAAAAETIKKNLEIAFNWCRDELPRIWNETWQSIRFTIDRVWTEVKPGLQEFVAGVLSIWEDVKPMLPLLRAGFVATWENLKLVFAGISAAWDFLWESFKGVLFTVWPLIVGGIKIGMESLKGVLAVGLAIVDGDWNKAWNKAKESLDKIWGLMVVSVKSSVNNMLAALLEQMGSFASVGERLMKAFANGIMRGGKAVKDASLEATGDIVTMDKRTTPDIKLYDGQPTKPTGFSWKPVGPGQGLLPEPPKPVLRTLNAANKAWDNVKTPLTSQSPEMKAAFDRVQKLLAEQGAGGKKAKPKTMLDELLSMQRQQFSGATVTSGFNDDRGVSTYRRTPGKHNGYDIAMPAGREVAAAWPGRVTAIIPWGQGEFGVTVQGGGKATTYGHISPAVAMGQEVGQGAFLGRVAKDHVDVKMKDATGKYVDFKNITATSQSKSLADDLAKSVRQYIDSGPYANSPEARLQKASREHDVERVKASTPEDRLAVDRRYAQEKAKLEREIAADEASVEAKRRQDLLAAYGDTQGMELEKIRETARLRRVEIQKQLEEDLAVKPQQAEALKANASQQMADVDLAKNNALREAELKFEQELPSFVQKHIEVLKQRDAVLQKTFETNARLREEHKLTLQGQLDADATALNSYVGTEDGKQQARLQYQELYKGYIEQQLQLTTDDQIATLEKTLAYVATLDQSLVSTQVQMGAVQDALRTARIAKMQTEKAQILAIGQQLAGSFEQFLVGVTTGQTKFNEGFKSLWQSITQTVIKYVAEMIIKVMALQKIMQAAFSVFGFGLGGAASSIGGSLGSFFGGAASVVDTSFTSFIPLAHTGGLVVPGGIQVLHAGGFAGLDIRPDEVLAKLQVGEMVLSRSQVEEARQGGSTRSEQPGVYSPITFSGAVYIREEADIDRLANAIAQRQREEWQAW